MKLFSYIALFIYSLIPLSLFAENRQNKVDSLQLVLQHAHLDTNNVLTKIELSTELYEMDAYSEAMEHALQAKALAEKLGFQSGLASACRRIGAIYTEQGKYPQAIEGLLSSIKIYEQLKDEHGIFMVNNNLGTVYYYQQDYDKALEYYMKSLAYKNSDGLTCSNIGMVYGEQNNFILALNFFFKSLASYKKSFDRSGISLALTNIGAVYELQNNLDSALLYYENSLNIKKEIQDYRGECDVLGSMGDIYFKENKYYIALKYQNKCLILSKQIGYLNGIKLTEQALSNIYFELKQIDKSFEHYKNYVAIRDSMFNEENTKQTVRFEMNHQFDKEQERIKLEQEKKDAIQAEQLKAQKFQKNVFIIGFSLLTFFLIIGFRGYKKIQKANKIIDEQKKIVEHKNKEVTDNINYAQRIQKAILPSDEYMKSCFPDNFIIYQPKDIVSGDFYWAYNDGISKYIATADCTGHGVSGAMMSMIGVQLLNEIVIERKITSPELVLNTLRDEIIKSLNQEGAEEERKDGMDISFCKITDMKLEVACANNPIYIVRNDEEIFEIKANRFPVGKYVTNESFTLNTFDLQKNDMLYCLSDGFCDQFGGEKGKKLMTKRFKEWIVGLPHGGLLNYIKLSLEYKFAKWIGKEEQIDDVTIFAVKIN